MRRWLLLTLGLVGLLILGAVVGTYLVVYGPRVPKSGDGGLEGHLRRWRMGDFSGYETLFSNPERFEEMLMLTFMRGDFTLKCHLEGRRLLCGGFAPISLREEGGRYEITSEIYLSDSTSPFGKLRRRLADWPSKLRNLTYYEALEVCVGQRRERTEIDSLYLEMRAYENDTTVLSEMDGERFNARFLEIFYDRFLTGHVCLRPPEIEAAHGEFSKVVKAREVPANLSEERRERERAVREVERRLEERLASRRDPMALAFYKRGLQAYSQGDLESARIFFKKALEIDPNFSMAKRNLEKVEELIGKNSVQ
ncbi:MAG: tetratricopeptide repeat protein [Thermotogae bacterium]|nr:tetratricopeptide repeat protein [Thermotogota bacterium]